MRNIDLLKPILQEFHALMLPFGKAFVALAVQIQSLQETLSLTNKYGIQDSASSNSLPFHMSLLCTDDSGHSYPITLPGQVHEHIENNSIPQSPLCETCRSIFTGKCHDMDLGGPAEGAIG